MGLWNFLKIYLSSVIIFSAIDFVWLSFIARNFYAKHIGFLFRPSPYIGAAVLFYLVYTGGLVLLVISPSLKEGSLTKAVLFGAVYGLCAYATYDLTNLATIKNWPTVVTIVDLIWGALITALVSFIIFQLRKFLV